MNGHLGALALLFGMGLPQVACQDTTGIIECRNCPKYNMSGTIRFLDSMGVGMTTAYADEADKFSSCCLLDENGTNGYCGTQQECERELRTSIFNLTVPQTIGFGVFAVLALFCCCCCMCACCMMRRGKKRASALDESASDSDSDGGDLPIPKRTAAMFLEACDKEYRNGDSGAVGDFLADEGVDGEDAEFLERAEDQIRDNPQMIDQYRSQWGV